MMEQAWIEKALASSDPGPMLQRFAAHYHYFSLHQIHALVHVFQAFERTDARSLAEVAQVVFDEFGEGDADRVHSVLFRRFAEAVGVRPDALPLEVEEVSPALRAYLDELELAFGATSRGRAVGAYVFLERSAVALYEPLLVALERLDVDGAALEFFRVHTEVELHHAGVAEALAARFWDEPGFKVAFESELVTLEQLWEGFWADLART